MSMPYGLPQLRLHSYSPNANIGSQSILSHIPKHTDFSRVKLFILVYSPGLKDTVTETTSTRAPASLSSSFSVVGPEQALTPGDEVKSPL